MYCDFLNIYPTFDQQGTVGQAWRSSQNYRQPGTVATKIAITLRRDNVVYGNQLKVRISTCLEILLSAYRQLRITRVYLACN